MSVIPFETWQQARQRRERQREAAERAEGMADALADALRGAFATKADLEALESGIDAQLAEIHAEIARLRADLRSFERRILLKTGAFSLAVVALAALLARVI